MGTRRPTTFVRVSSRRRHRTVESLNQNRVTDMLAFVSQQFALIIVRCHGRDTSQTNGVRSSVQIRTMSEFRRICHSMLPQVESGRIPPMSLACHYAATILEALGLFAKHTLHITGLPCVGLNGTVVCPPHSEQVTWVSTRRRPVVACLLALHCLQCFGSLTNPFSRKNSCSPEENTNITPQPAHRTSRSAKGIVPSTLSRFREGSTGWGQQSLCENWMRVRHLIPF
jgi:hypothetical protein